MIICFLRFTSAVFICTTLSISEQSLPHTQIFFAFTGFHRPTCVCFPHNGIQWQLTLTIQDYKFTANAFDPRWVTQLRVDLTADGVLILRLCAFDNIQSSAAAERLQILHKILKTPRSNLERNTGHCCCFLLLSIPSTNTPERNLN